MTTFTLRIPDELNEWLERQAKLNKRSKNKEIEHILEVVKEIKIISPWIILDKERESQDER